MKARNSTLDNLLPIFELSPETVIFGGWDSTRSKNQLRIPSVMVGETYAILAEQEEDPVIHRAGGRIDPVGASVIVSTEADRQKIVGDSIDLSDKTKTSFKKSGKGSTIGLGAIPPSAKKDVLDGVSVRKVISTRVLSFATVRTFHFGKGVEGDAAIRALILAVLLRDIWRRKTISREGEVLGSRLTMSMVEKIKSIFHIEYSDIAPRNLKVIV